MKFKKAIVKKPGKSMMHGLTTVQLGIPDCQSALRQHKVYTEALRTCGLQVQVLPPSEAFPDSTFVEDVALLTPHCAIITNPGAPTRREEIHEIKPVIQAHFQEVFEIQPPGTVEAGDIMMVGSHFYIGISQRTNQEGAEQIIGILNRYGLTGSLLKLDKVLHLKSGVAYLENNNLLACGEFVHHPAFHNLNVFEIDEDEHYAANCVWINDHVLVPMGYPKARKLIEMVGYKIIDVDVSEFRKIDGGLSCLSLRF